MPNQINSYITDFYVDIDKSAHKKHELNLLKVGDKFKTICGGAFLIDSLKAFDTLSHEFLIAKL